MRNRAESEPQTCCPDNQPCDVGVRLHPQPMTTGRSPDRWLLDRASRYLSGSAQYLEAKPLADRGIAVTESALGPDNPEVAWRTDASTRRFRPSVRPAQRHTGPHRQGPTSNRTRKPPRTGPSPPAPEPDPIVIATAHLYPPQVRIVQEEEPLQLSPAGLPDELAIHRSLLIAQELHRHKINLEHNRPARAPDPVPLRPRPRLPVRPVPAR